MFYNSNTEHEQEKKCKFLQNHNIDEMLFLQDLCLKMESKCNVPYIPSQLFASGENSLNASRLITTLRSSSDICICSLLYQNQQESKASQPHQYGQDSNSENNDSLFPHNTLRTCQNPDDLQPFSQSLELALQYVEYHVLNSSNVCPLFLHLISNNNLISWSPKLTNLVKKRNITHTCNLTADRKS